MLKIIKHAKASPNALTALSVYFIWLFSWPKMCGIFLSMYHSQLKQSGSIMAVTVMCVLYTVYTVYRSGTTCDWNGTPLITGMLKSWTFLPMTSGNQTSCFTTSTSLETSQRFYFYQQRIIFAQRFIFRVSDIFDFRLCVCVGGGGRKPILLTIAASSLNSKQRKTHATIVALQRYT